MYVRTNNVVENYRQMEKKVPKMTLAYGLKGMLTCFTNHDYLGFFLNEERFGTDAAVDLYAELWRRRTIVEYRMFKKELGIPEDREATIEELMDMFELYFDTFGNPWELVQKGPDVYEGKVVDCPYTTEIVWELYDKEQYDHFNEAVQVACNTAIFEEFLRQAKLDREWLFAFPNQCCRYGGFCSFVFRRRIPESAKK
jgi:hypothetical protein